MNILRKYSEFFGIVPLTAFVTVARYKGLLSEGAKSEAWQEPFYYGAVAALLMIGLHFFLNIPFKRLILGLYIFLIGSAALFLSGNEYLLSLLSNYSGPAFFLSIIIATLIAIVWPIWFEKETGISEDRNLRISYKLILCCIVAFFWSIMLNDSGIFAAIAIPFIGLRLFASLIERNALKK